MIDDDEYRQLREEARDALLHLLRVTKPGTGLVLHQALAARDARLGSALHLP